MGGGYGRTQGVWVKRCWGEEVPDRGGEEVAVEDGGKGEIKMGESLVTRRGGELGKK